MASSSFLGTTLRIRPLADPERLVPLFPEAYVPTHLWMETETGIESLPVEEVFRRMGREFKLTHTLHTKAKHQRLVPKFEHAKSMALEQEQLREMLITWYDKTMIFYHEACGYGIKVRPGKILNPDEGIPITGILHFENIKELTASQPNDIAYADECKTIAILSARERGNPWVLINHAGIKDHLEKTYDVDKKTLDRIATPNLIGKIFFINNIKLECLVAEQPIVGGTQLLWAYGFYRDIDLLEEEGIKSVAFEAGIGVAMMPPMPLRMVKVFVDIGERNKIKVVMPLAFLLKKITEDSVLAIDYKVGEEDKCIYVQAKELAAQLPEYYYIPVPDDATRAAFERQLAGAYRYLTIHTLMDPDGEQRQYLRIEVASGAFTRDLQDILGIDRQEIQLKKLTFDRWNDLRSEGSITVENISEQNFLVTFPKNRLPFVAIVNEFNAWSDWSESPAAEHLRSRGPNEGEDAAVILRPHRVDAVNDDRPASPRGGCCNRLWHFWNRNRRREVEPLVSPSAAPRYRYGKDL